MEYRFFDLGSMKEAMRSFVAHNPDVEMLPSDGFRAGGPSLGFCAETADGKTTTVWYITLKDLRDSGGGIECSHDGRRRFIHGLGGKMIARSSQAHIRKTLNAGGGIWVACQRNSGGMLRQSGGATTAFFYSEDGMRKALRRANLSEWTVIRLDVSVLEEMPAERFLVRFEKGKGE